MNAERYKQDGLHHFRAERLGEAATAFDQAAVAYQLAGDGLNAAEMRNNLCVVKMAQQDWTGALAAVEGTDAIFAAAGDRLRRAQAVANLAAVHEGLGHTNEALRYYQVAVDLFGELGETETRAASFKKLGALQLKAGQQLESIVSMRSGLRLSKSLTKDEQRLKKVIDQAGKLLGF